MIIMNELEKANTINWSEKVRNLDENIRREIGIEGENEAKHILIKVQTKAAECIEPAFIVDEDDTFLLYFCTKGKAVIQEKQVNYSLKEGDLILVPAESNEFFLLPETSDAELLEIRMDPRPENDIVSEPVDEE